MHAATVGLGTWEPGPKGSGILGRGTSGWDPCQLLAFQQLSALLTLWRTGWVHSIVIACLSWNGARFNNSLHCEWRGKKIQKEEETDQLEADGPISHQPRQAVGRLHSSDRGRSSFCSRSGLAGSRGSPPSARPTSPARCCRLVTGSLWLEGWALGPPRGRGVCVWAGTEEGVRWRGGGASLEW